MHTIILMALFFFGGFATSYGIKHNNGTVGSLGVLALAVGSAVDFG